MQPTADGERKTFEGWVILELMGHRRLGGWIAEEEIAGTAFLRLDLPEDASGDGWQATQFYAPAAVYCITPTTEDTARYVASVSKAEPVSEWEVRFTRPELIAATTGTHEED